MKKNSPFFERQCPHCRAATKAHSEVVANRSAETMSYDEIAQAWNHISKERVFFSYFRCETCGLLFAPVFLTEDKLGELYRQMPPNMDVVEPGVLRATQRGYFELLKPYARLDGGYLELGADVGLFTENCVAEGSFDRYYLVEPNREVAPTLREVVGDKPCVIIHDMFDFTPVPEASVGVAAMIHVLDHLIEPLDSLKAIRAKLAPGGALLIVTHDESSLLRRIFRRNWPPFCMQHPQLFSPKSMRAMLTAAGFRNIQVKRTANHFPVGFLVQQFLWACGLKVDRAPSFGGLTVGLKLGNMMTLATA
jgi:hypothetical protein